MTVVRFIVQAGALAGAVGAIAGLLAGAWWTVRKLVQIADAVGQLLPDGGTTLADKVDAMSRKLDAHLADCHASQAEAGH